MRKKLALLGFALLATAATFLLQPRPAEASSCFCADPQCCSFCCPLPGGKVICSARAC